MPSQYGEEAIINKYFKGLKSGMVVDVGAADGITGSNSKFLIDRGWNAILIEPNPHNYKKLIDLYRDNQLVQVCPKACYSSDLGIIPFYCDTYDGHGQISTMDLSFRDKWDKVYNAKYVEVTVECVTLTQILNDYNISKIDFLSIDCEGVDLEVLKGIDWNKLDLGLICVEDQGEYQSLVIEFLGSVGFKQFDRTCGNVFFTHS